MLHRAALFAALPATLRDELFSCYDEIVRSYVEHRWEPAELNGGKLCEVVYSILDGSITGNFPVNASKPANMVAACRALENTPPSATRVGERSLRILIPRLLPFLYEIRNNRGVGHVGGEVNPNQADAEAVMTMASWLIAELVRVFHNVSLADAQATVNTLVERRHPLVWKVENTKRVLDSNLAKSDQALILLYSETGWTDVTEICTWVEYSNASMFKSRILSELHRSRLVEFDSKKSIVRISPLGIQRVEEMLNDR